MSANEEWQTIVANSLGWEEAHTSLEHAIAGLPAELRASRPPGMAHSVWDILEHIRIAQHDLLDFCTNPDYHHDLNWPADYWPKETEKVSREEWEASIAAFSADRSLFREFTVNSGLDLSAKIPWGTGQTFLRTVLVALDHASYHTGEIVTVRRMLGAWPPS